MLHIKFVQLVVTRGFLKRFRAISIKRFVEYDLIGLKWVGRAMGNETFYWDGLEKKTRFIFSYLHVFSTSKTGCTSPLFLWMSLPSNMTLPKPDKLTQHLSSARPIFLIGQVDTGTLRVLLEDLRKTKLDCTNKHEKTYLAMMAMKGETKRFMYLDAGSYALLNLESKKKYRNRLKRRVKGKKYKNWEETRFLHPFQYVRLLVKFRQISYWLVNSTTQLSVLVITMHFFSLTLPGVRGPIH